MDHAIRPSCRLSVSLLLATMLVASIFSLPAAGASWPPPQGVPMTRWAKEVSPERPVLPEYPRPQLVRKSWLNLNGPWDYCIAPKEAAAPGEYQGKILVPFAPQSVLSQVNKSVDDKQCIWYHRTLEIPSEWSGRQIMLNFGAVNWESRVEVNGKLVGTHTGGYDGFAFDITAALHPTGPQDLVVWAYNPVEGGQPHGKQSLRPDGIFYTPTTGIWQTVWLEPVAASHIDELRMVPDVDRGELKLTVNVHGSVEGQTVEAVALDGGKEVARTSGRPGEALVLPIHNPKLWWPASPFLYDLKVTLRQTAAASSKTLDSVDSYFGMRKISIGPDEKGLARIMLNNKPVFHNGFLDQGFWPDGIYTAPTDEALRFDLEALKRFGYNMDRKHIKVEPDRWYYWADRLGVLVWQDMPAVVELSFPPNARSIKDREGNYESELRRMIRGRFNHPSVVMWILFNEGWGLPRKDRKSDKEPEAASDVAKSRIARMVQAAREEDPTRLIDPESGVGGGGNGHREDLFDIGLGDVIDYHCYGHDSPPAEKKRAAIVGEYGWGLSPVGALRNRLEESKNHDISGCVLTQLTDVENEHNGALKYDRTPVPNVEREKDVPGDVRRLLKEYGYSDYPGGGDAAVPAKDAAPVSLTQKTAPSAPQIFWASTPVRPNETVLLQGSGFGNAAVVTLGRLEDNHTFRLIAVPAFQTTDCSLKFTVPAEFEMGVFLCRVTVDGVASQPELLNAPDVWWLQGDRGASATPGGWLRAFGKSLDFGKRLCARLKPEDGPMIALDASDGDCYAARFALPRDLKPGKYAVEVHNGFGGMGWCPAGTIVVETPAPWPTKVFSVLDTYGKDAVPEMRKTLNKYAPVPDRTAGIQAALKKAKENGGGVVYFPAGRYGIQGDLDVPPRTVLKGEGTGLVVLWWGHGRFNLDGGSDEGLDRKNVAANLPPTLIHGTEFGLEDMSIYLPLAYQTGISCSDRFHMRKVRVRIDHYWAMDGRKRPEGLVARLGNNAEVTSCDILAKGAALAPGDYCWIDFNRIMAGKTNCPLGGAEQVIVEHNRFVSLFPTAYQNISGSGRNLYYARNLHEALEVHQADYSFTFDAGDTAYFGKLAATDGTQLTLADDPVYPKWSPEKSGLWHKAIVCIQDGRGAGQWRNVVANEGRHWTIDREFDCAPDDTSLVTIVPMNGRVLVVGNRFEDANWVNASYGTAIDVIFAENQLYRCAQLVNYGMIQGNECRPSWYVQYFDNELHEGQTSADTTGSVRNPGQFTCPVTRCTIHRRNLLAEDNSGDISISGATRDVIVEGCILRNPASSIITRSEAKDVLLRNNTVEHR